MKLTFLGSSSFLASYCVEKFENDELNLWSRTPIAATENHAHHRFELPTHAPKVTQLLNQDAVIYFASAGVQAGKDDPKDLLYRVNVHYPTQLAIQLQESGFQGKFITFGSYFELGNLAPEKAAKELDIISSSGPVPNHYCASKRMLTSFWDSGLLSELKWYHLILPTIYGPGEHQNRLIPYLISSFRQNLCPALTSGEQIRQYLFAGDAAEIISLLLNGKIPNGIYNLPGKETLSVKNLVLKLAKSMNFTGDLNFGKLPRKDISMKHLELNADKLGSFFKFPNLSSIEDVSTLYP